jgi:hypothetical protein
MSSFSWKASSIASDDADKGSSLETQEQIKI